MAIRWLLTILAWMVLLDGAVSLWGETTGRGGLLVFLRAMVAIVALLFGLALYVGCAFTPRLPKRFLMPTGLFLIWGNFCAAFPLSLWMGKYSGIVLACLECALGLWLVLAFRGKEKFFPLRNPAEDRPTFSWRNLLLFSGANVVLIPILIAACVISACVTTLERSTAGFMTVRPTGIFIQERQFERGGERVHLIGMMHVAQKNFYDTVLANISEKEKSVVLLEGVSDRKKIMAGNDLGMKRLSQLLGMDSQRESSFSENARAGLEAEDSEQESPDAPVRYVRADRDISDFRPPTIACLREVGALAACNSLQELAQRIGNPNCPLLSQKNEEILMEDILHGRNDYILAKIEESAPKYDNVLVPWGAMHMPYLEQKLIEQGFHETRRIDRKAIAFF